MTEEDEAALEAAVVVVSAATEAAEEVSDYASVVTGEVEVVDEVDVAQAEEEVSQVVVVDPVDEDLVEMVVGDSMAVEEVDLVAVEVAVEVLGAISIKYDRCTERMYCGLNIGPNILREMIRFLGHILYIIVSLNTRIAQCCFLL